MENNIDTVLKDPVPEMPNPASSIVQLQRGVYSAEVNGWVTEAEVRELTGADEEYLAAVEAKSNLTYSEYITALLRRVVLSVGDTKVEDNPSIIDDLTIGDRDVLYLGVVRSTHGIEREFTTSCPSCSVKNDVVINLDNDFPLEGSSDELREPIVVKLRNGLTVKLRLPTGADTAYIGKKASSPASQNTLMLARCTIWEDSASAPKNKEEWAKNLNSGDRTKLLKALSAVKSGPRMEGVNVQCAQCGYDMPIKIDWMSLLFS